MNIPKIIHQIWIGPKNPPIKWMKTWPQNNPDYQYIHWDENKLKNFYLRNKSKLPWIGEWHGKADIIRYEILYQFGGIFLDADLISLRPLDSFLLEQDSFSVYEHELTRPGLVACGVMGCKPNNKIMLSCINKISKMGPSDIWKGPLTSWQTTGPQFFTDTIKEIEYRDIAILPSFFFLPKHYTGYKNYSGGFTPYAEHYWGSTPQSEVNYE